MTLVVGLDTGGTYTDGVLFDPAVGVLARAKALTTPRDLSQGLGAALRQVVASASTAIDRVCISTTLATNAVVEGHTSPVALVGIGFDARLLARGGLGEALADDPRIFVSGGHDSFGEQAATLGLEAARPQIEAATESVRGFAVVGRFAVRNPEHEEQMRELIRGLSGLPVTCSHEMSSKLDAPKRALTTVLNARLIPRLQQLIEAVQAEMAREGIRAPLMVVKGDGSLEDAAVALRRPVETVLSGPAASVLGAQHLAGEDHCVVVDMGGTTTDIAVLNRGVPRVDEGGAWLADWHTMVEAVSVHTFGLGGDSEVRIGASGEIAIGPRRQVPISRLIHEHPDLMAELEGQLADSPKHAHGHFVVRLRDATEPAGLVGQQGRLWDALEQGPVSLATLESKGFASRTLDALVDRGFVIRCGFTPSDASHVLGRHTEWSARAAGFAADLWLRKQQEGRLFESAEAFAAGVIESVTRMSGRRVIEALIAESSEYWLGSGGELGSAMVDWALDAPQSEQRLVQPRFEIDRPIVAIGAPAAVYYPAIGERLDARWIVPEDADVANAVGAAAAGIMQTATILVTSPEDSLFRVHLPDGTRDLRNLDEAWALASEGAARVARERAERAGGTDVELSEYRDERSYRPPIGERVLVEGRVTAKAMGRPRG